LEELIFEDKWRIHVLGELNLKRLLGEKKNEATRNFGRKWEYAYPVIERKKITFMLFIFFFVHCKQDTATQ